MLIDIQYIYTICLKSPDIDDQQDIMIYIAYFFGGWTQLHTNRQTHSLTEKETKTENKLHWQWDLFN